MTAYDIDVYANKDEFSIQVTINADGVYCVEVVETGVVFNDLVATEIVQRLESLQGDQRLKMSAIHGAEEIAEDLEEISAMIENFDCGLF